MAPPSEDSGGKLLGIGEAASRTGTSERALRYYQELGLIQPSGCTPGGLRRYSESDLARVAHLRELQNLLGFNLDEIRVVFESEDRLAEMRRAYAAEDADDLTKRTLLEEAFELRSELREAVVAKRDALNSFLQHLDEDRAKTRALLDREPSEAAG